MTPERLGQHFLDVRWRERIAHAIFGLGAATPAAQPHKSSGLWIEIGAGHGEMTSILAQHASRVIAIELDATLVERLRETTAALGNVAVVSGNVLELDFAELADDSDLGGESGTRFHVYGNLPYYISSPIVHRLFDNPARVESAFIVVQREVAERIAASPGHREYGYFSAFTQFYSRPEILLRIPPGAFHPPPQVHSALVALRPPGGRANLQVHDDCAFLKFLKVCFAHKRKTLRNNLRALLSSVEAQESMLQTGLAADARAEQLTLAQFARLFANISNADR
jgi:16S rRNA (adenine1518-N6/adenine1519-N6)-dimethyltransferase